MKRSQSPPEPQGRLTVRDLARHAGVSAATVSLVLRNSPLVAAKTRARVVAAMSALGYVYNRGAASLRTQRTQTVGVAISDLVNPYFAELTAAIERALRGLGRMVFLSNSNEDPQRQDAFVDTMREYNADGLIICPAEGTTPSSIKRVLDCGMPCVLVSRSVPGVAVDYAGNDHALASFLATEHLLELGHTRIATIGGTAQTSTGRERRQGYRQALAARGLSIDPALSVPCAPSREGGARAIRTLLEGSPPPTAAVCFNDVLAFGVMLGLRQLGLEPGADFAVAGCDDVAEAALWTPALTTVAIDTAAMGEAAARLLMERIAEPMAPRREVILRPRLVVRQTSGRPRRRGGAGRREQHRAAAP